MTLRAPVVLDFKVLAGASHNVPTEPLVVSESASAERVREVSKLTKMEKMNTI